MENKYIKKFMLLAIEEAKKVSRNGEVPVGAVIVYKNNVIARSGNLMVKYSNPLMHAEMIVLKKATEVLLSLIHISEPTRLLSIGDGGLGV